MRKELILFSVMLILTSCNESVFTGKVNTVSEPNVVDLSMERIDTDFPYSEFFAVFDTLLISSRPNNSEFNYYVSDLKSGELLGSFMHRGQGPGEYLGLTPIRRVERKGEDLISLIYEPNKRQLIEWNISQSIKTGKDSLLLLGTYKNSNECGFTYAGMYKLGNSGYLGYTPGFSFDENSEVLFPTYWILDGTDNEPVHGMSIVKAMISNKKSVISDNFFFSSNWSLSPDNTKIIDAMNWLKQVNIIDMSGGGVVTSYRIDGSPDESVFQTTMENALYQYHDVVCNNDHIYALYFGEPFAVFNDSMGCRWLHEFDWNGNFTNKYRLPVSIFKIWLDPSSNTLYGICDEDESLYKYNLE